VLINGCSDELSSATIPIMKDAKLAEYAKFGVAFHHAGLDTADRHTVENMFIDGRLMLIVSTSVSDT